MVKGLPYTNYRRDTDLALGVAPSTLRTLITFILEHTHDFVTKNLEPRPLAEIIALAAKFYNELGLDLPSEEWASIVYVGDARHYHYTLQPQEPRRPKNQEYAEVIREQNRGKWREDVVVDGEVYSKVSYKPRTQGKTCITHTVLWDISGLCFCLSCCSLWMSGPDNRYYVASFKSDTTNQKLKQH